MRKKMFKNIKKKLSQVWSLSGYLCKLGLRFLMDSISYTKQSNLPWHFLKTVNWFSFKKLLLP